MVYPNLAWESWKVKDELPWKIIETPDDMPSAGIIALDFRSGFMLPEGFFYDRRVDGVWEWFTRYEMAPEGKQYKPSRLPALRAGQYVLCTGKVLGGNGDGAVLVAFAQARETSKAAELRRFAVVAFADELRLAVLMDQQEGWIQLPETRSEVSSEELQALLAKVPEFLGNLPKVTTLQTKFSRLLPPAEPLRHRSQRTAAVGATSAEADATAAPPQKESQVPAPSLSFDLKGVQVGKLRALSEGQLLELCNERELQMASDAGAPQMLQALLQFRNREGRTRRASGSSSGRGGRRIFDDDDDGGDLAGDNDDDEATQREHER